MTDQELDRMPRRAPLDAADQEAQTPPETETPLSEGHRRRMREMPAGPAAVVPVVRNPYPWRTVAWRAAVVSLMLSLSAATVLAVSPKAWADTHPVDHGAGWPPGGVPLSRRRPRPGSAPIPDRRLCRRAIRKRSG